MIKASLKYLIIAIMFPLMVQAQESGSLKGKRVLFTYGGWKGHEPLKCLELLKPWLEEEGAKVDTFTKLDVYADSVYMASVDLIIQVHTMSKITKVQSDGLLKAVMNGTGIAGWHGGVGDSFRNNVGFQFMIGG